MSFDCDSLTEEYVGKERILGDGRRFFYGAGKLMEGLTCLG